MEFFTNYNRPQRKRETFNNTKQAVYKAVYDKNGVRSLIKDKEVDIYEKIQEYAKDTSLTNMFSKYGLSVYDQLKKSEEQLVDLTNLPTNLMEAMSVIDEAKYAFDRQSKDVKAKFNNDFKQFIAASETGQLAQLLNDEIKTSVERFQTANMVNFDAQKVNLQQYTQPANTLQQFQAQNTQVVNQPINQTQQTTTQQGVNLNV